MASLEGANRAAQLAPLLSVKYSPIRANGMGNQGIYLGAVSAAMGTKLKKLLAGQVEAIESGTGWEVIREAEETQAEKIMDQRTDIGPMDKQRLVDSRRG